MQRFLSTASLSVLTAIAIVVYSSDHSTPMAQDGPSEHTEAATLGLLDAAWLNPFKGDFVEHSSAPEADFDLNVSAEQRYDARVMGKNDLLALAPAPFSNCDVGLLSHSPLRGKLQP